MVRTGKGGNEHKRQGFVEKRKSNRREGNVNVKQSTVIKLLKGKCRCMFKTKVTESSNALRGLDKSAT